MAGTGTLTPPLFAALATYASWMVLFLFGHLRDFYRKKIWSGASGAKLGREGYAPIRQDYEDFYTRRMYYRIHDTFNRPICTAPTAWVDVMKRTPVDGQKPLQLTGETQRCLNLGSYNYLGFAAQDEYCTPRVEEVLDTLDWASCSARVDAGTTPRHAELESLVADFLGKEDAITCGMGFATNSAFIPLLSGKGTLLISDALNHASIVAGVRGAGAKVKVFDHNEPAHLEAVLRAAIAEGQPRTGRPWKKIIIIVEGIYSMEGEMARLKEIVAIKKKYKAYLYLDEAHSVGALGAGGRGVCEQLGVDTADVDIMMGTFTKSFGSCGGYIAGDRGLIQYLRQHAPAHLYATAMSPPAVEMVISALHVIQGRDGSGRGKQKIAQLRDNSNYFRRRLIEQGYDVLGDWDSPVMPVMVFHPAKLPAVSRFALSRGLAIVVVGFPATPLLTARIRVCISAAHTRADLDYALEVFAEMIDRCRLKYCAEANQQLLARLQKESNLLTT
ncbi:long chain base biosynthesis 2a [Micractinium conductrix]|uniref:serine C-palmitoyltransferase n=1 Tax=Micractinium conductrix TaxID=554055 RepID=A0A2P6V8E4_9CHLO|nr:long chain base biosynthesis 2a [Micractinium conductrix]|eukprot:PSC70357.1 long chain base biosynthesis 2a [Micractinium conductrix]